MVLSKSILLLLHMFPLLMKGAFITLLVAAFALCIGLIGGIIFGFLSCDKYKSWWSILIKTYVLVIRGTPVTLQVLLIYFAVPAAIGFNFSPFIAGVITLGINSIAYVAEIIRGSINAINQGQWDACYVVGLSKMDTVKAVILPQIVPLVMAPLTNESIALLKETSIISIIGLLELTRIGMNISAQTLDPISTYCALAVIYLCMTASLSFCSKILERKVTA